MHSSRTPAPRAWIARSLFAAMAAGNNYARAAPAHAPAHPPSLLPRQGALAGINDVLSDAGQKALDKAQHRTAGLSTLQLSILIVGILLFLALACFGLWWCIGARAQRRHARQAQQAAATSAISSDEHKRPLSTSQGGTENWTRFHNESQVTSSTSLNKL